MPQPQKEDWLRIAEEYEKTANFPNCIGALDALVDANYCFVTVDVGSYGRTADSNIFTQSVLYNKLVKGSLNLPEDKSLPNCRDKTPMPYVFVADDAFGMGVHVMKPFAKKRPRLKKKKVIVLATCVLHNFVRLRDGIRFEETLLSCDMTDIPVIGTGNPSLKSKDIRDKLADYFVSPSGSVPWQYDMI
ncbi:hypothetical protein NQ314_010471 [Rhamnusium bicolor]|uniref:DDE Tnp4 domain-containing protein n=1 Tax=Rhamnusium bicolor TaxID=1586634 RepID=A0AAV8XQQ3_9CUCU|nr:hypothetical protein NQ314_010471 [Rhamnusium bicolor]